MVRSLILCSLASAGVAGCCSPSPPEWRVVPASTVVRVLPQPTTGGGFRAAEQHGYLVAATGRGPAFDAGDQPIELQEGEALRVLRVDPTSGEVVACRRQDGKLVRLSSDGLEVETTTYGH